MAWESLLQTGGKWSPTEELMFFFSESGHPVFRCSSQLSRGALEKQEGRGRCSVHHTADPKTAELFSKRRIAVKWLSIFGADGTW